MKKLLSVILAFTVVISSLSLFAFAEGVYPLKREEVRVRDPYVLVHDGKYYMYGTGLSNGAGYGCRVSEDLENWSERIQVYTPYDNPDAIADFWAPECHYYEGSFYLFATYRSGISGKRGTAIFKSESPTGPFTLWSDGHITPRERDCIDGTLYIDETGQPWMVYVNEWTSNSDGIGEMAAAKLSADLKTFINEPIVLFKANNHIWTGEKNHVTDGPCLYRTKNNSLIMLWSNGAESGGYAVGMAVSDNGKIDGNWIHYPFAFYKKDNNNQYDGGHPMLFETLEGELMMSIHSPNYSDENIFESFCCFPIDDMGNHLAIKSDNFLKTLAIDAINNVFYIIMKIRFKFV